MGKRRASVPGSSAVKESIYNAGDPSSYSWVSLVAQVVKESTCHVGDLGSIPELGRSPGERKDYPLRYSGLENSMDCIVHGFTKSRTSPYFLVYILTLVEPTFY